MARNYDDQSSIRRYLLNQLTDDEQQQIEQRLLTDDDLFEQFQATEDELVDQYLSGVLTKEETKMFEKHFLVTPERQLKLRFAKAFRRYVSTYPSELSPQTSNQPQRIAEQPRTSWPWLKLFSASPLRAAAFAALILVAGLGVWRIFFYQSDVDKALIALSAAYRDQRPVESRITKLSYAPFVTTRGAGQNKVADPERERAKMMLVNAQSERPSAAVHHALGKVNLAENEFDRAIEQFDKALKADPNNAEIHADLGAAWLEKGKADAAKISAEPSGPVTGKALEELGRSLEHLNRALELNPNSLEAFFNRALCLEYQGLPLRAEEEWREYLKKDPTSLWSEEARRRLRLLEAEKRQATQTKANLFQDFQAAFESKDDEKAWQIIRQHRDVSGGPIENSLIDNYLQLASTGRLDESHKSLEILSFAGELERERAGDLFIPDLVRLLRSLSGSQRDSLVAARALLKQGRESLIQSNLEAAVQYYNSAKEGFEHLGDAGEALYAEYPLGHSYLLQAKSELSLATFQHVVELSEKRQYKWLQAQALNATANAELGLTNYSAALEASHRSLALSEQIGDTTGVIKTTSQLAQQYFTLGNYDRSLALHQQSLALAKVTVPEPMQSWRNYFYIAWPLNAMGLHWAAIEYEKEALRQAEEMKAPHTICRSNTVLGLMYAGRSDYQAAIRHVEIALELGKQIKSETSQKESIAYSALQLGHLYRQAGDFTNSIESYDQALQLYGELENYQAFSYLAHKGKLLSCIRQEGCPSVEEEIKTCLDLFETYRLKILELSNRETFFDKEHTIYDVAIEYEFSQSNFQTAFEYSERARSRSLLDSASNDAKPVGGSIEPDVKFSSTTAPLRFEEIKKGLPPQTQVIQYAVLNNRLFIWLISNKDFSHQAQVISLAELNAKLLPYLKLISSPSVNNLEELTRQGRDLYDILIKPIEPSLSKDTLLCIVPDKTLNYLPFVALVSTQSGKYLGDEYHVISAPSSTMFIRSSDSSRLRATQPERLLAVGNPRISREEFPLLSDLPSAAREVLEIKSYYGKSSRVLIGASATKRAVEVEMKRSNVVHFAMHSVVDEDSPLRSKLIFATEASSQRSRENSGVLYAYEIDSSRLELAHLVILSACETGVGRYYRGEGMMGLSRTFIAAGVPQVIGSLWPVDSDSTADLMIAFHAYRKNRHFSSAEALQMAQRDMATSTDQRYRHPYYWAAFTLVGGAATS